jgi:hypothetical protein
VALLARSPRPSLSLNLGWRHQVSAALCLTGLVAAVAGEVLLVGLGLAGLLASNAAFYTLLVRRQGLLRAAAGVGLHALHHLVAVAALPVGLAAAGVDAAGARHRRPAPVAAPQQASIP